MRPGRITLARIHDADHVALYRILRETRTELLARPECAAHNLACYAAPRTFQLRMLALDTAARTFGVESIKRAHADEWAEYLNTGDSYAPTLIYWRGKYRVQSISDFIECSRVHWE